MRARGPEYLCVRERARGSFLRTVLCFMHYTRACAHAHAHAHIRERERKKCARGCADAGVRLCCVARVCPGRMN